MEYRPWRTTLEGVDLSFARPGGRAIAAAGKKFVIRYVPYPGDGGKGLTLAEVKDYRAHGLDIVLVFESSRARALFGYSAGQADARLSNVALTHLGMPSDLPIYFAVDWDAAADQQVFIENYLNGAASILGRARVGIYGGYYLIKRTQASGKARWFWQTYAWSNGKVAAGIHLHQYRNGQSINGGAVDLDRALQANFGQWRAPAATPLPDTSTEEPMEYEAKFERWRRSDGVLITTVGAPKRADGTVDYTSRLALYSNAGVYRLESVSRADIDPVSADLNDEIIDILAHYALPAVPPDMTPYSQAQLDAAVQAIQVQLDTLKASQATQINAAVAADRTKAKAVLAVGSTGLVSARVEYPA